jgi:hypothetical protein
VPGKEETILGVLQGMSRLLQRMPRAISCLKKKQPFQHRLTSVLSRTDIRFSGFFSSSDL